MFKNGKRKMLKYDENEIIIHVDKFYSIPIAFFEFWDALINKKINWINKITYSAAFVNQTMVS